MHFLYFLCTHTSNTDTDQTLSHIYCLFAIYTYTHGTHTHTHTTHTQYTEHKYYILLNACLFADVFISSVGYEMFTGDWISKQCSLDKWR